MMQRQTRKLSGTAAVNGVDYHYVVELTRAFLPGSQPKFWGVGDICKKEIDPKPDEAVLADVLHEVLKRCNEDPNRPDPVMGVADAMRHLLDVASQMGSIDLARKVGSDWPDLDGLHERGQQALLKKSIAFYEALQELTPENPRYFVELHGKTESGPLAVGVGPLPQAAPPPSPAGKAN